MKEGSIIDVQICEGCWKERYGIINLIEDDGITWTMRYPAHDGCYWTYKYSIKNIRLSEELKPQTT